MSIQGFNIEEDNEEIRDEIEEGVNMYEEDKAIPAYDIKLTLDDVSGMTPGVITEKPGLKIIGDIIEETAIRLIKNIANQKVMTATIDIFIKRTKDENIRAKEIKDLENHIDNLKEKYENIKEELKQMNVIVT
jgi:hypothetical protein